MGTGHVMRQITLGAALHKLGASPILFCHEISQSLIERAKDQLVEVQFRESPQADRNIIEEINSFPSDAIVFDGYGFDVAAITSHFNQGIPTIVIDDNGEFAHVPCHVLVNQNLHARESTYVDNPAHPKLLLGLKWALIRQEIVTESRTRNEASEKKIFIAMGGSDHLGLTKHIEDELHSRNFLTHAASGFYSPKGMTPAEMALAMAQSSALVIGCGTTVWEAMLLGKPLVGVITADNQSQVGDSLVRAGVCEVIDCRTETNISAIADAVVRLFESEKEYASHVQRVSTFIDGNGAHRVAEEILQLIKAAD